MSESLGQWHAAHLDAAFERYPDPRTLQLRMDRLARAYPPALTMLVEGGEEVQGDLTALLSLGDAPVDEVIRHPHLLTMLLDRPNLADPFAENPPPLPNLTRWKRHIWLKILLRERLRLADFEQSAEAFARLADDTARLAMAALPPDTAPVILFAMGKWGGRELNASSDIDPVFFAPAGSRSEETDRTVRAWTALLAGGERGDAIYPVDLRLRPEGASGPLSCNVGEAERYFFQRAASWERIAYLRARHLFGPLPEWFGTMLDEFLYGGSVDPRTRARDVARALRNVHASAQERDLKRSPGGIRDIEFLVASYQLTEGQQNDQLRRGTVLHLLRALEQSGSLTLEQARTLSEGYVLLRSAEHALQAEEDRPRFVLPTPGTPLHNRLAWALGLPVEQLESRVKTAMDGIVSLVDELLLAEAPVVGTGTTMVDPQADPVSQTSSVDDSQAAAYAPVLRRLSGPWGQPSALFDASQLTMTTDPQELLLRLESSVASYGGPGAWKQAFGHSEALRARITRILRFGKRLLDEANQRPYLWERVGTVHETPPPPERASEKTLADWLGDCLFLTGEQFIEGELPIDRFTALWSETVDQAIKTISEPLLTGSSPKIALLALGKWGGRELAPDADLDLMFVCEDADGSAVAGAVQHAVRWMQHASLGGRLLLDARLRPEGGSAPMVITLSRLEEYLSSRAQPWERMALVRARHVTGDSAVGQKAMAILQYFSTHPPNDPDWSKIDLARKKTAELSRPRHGVLRLKKGIGGMMDFEFAATFLGWRRGLPPGEWWHRPIADRLRSLADGTGSSLMLQAAEAYLDLRRWDLIQLISSGHRRGDIRTEGDEARRFADAAGLAVPQIDIRWKEIAAYGREVYEMGLKGL